VKKFRYIWLLIFLTLLLPACTAAQPEDAEVSSQGPTWQEQYDLGVRYLSEGNYEEAILAFTAAIEIDPKQAPAYIGRGDAYTRLTIPDYDHAEADYKNAIEIDDQLFEVYGKLADIYIVQENIDKAIDILRKGYEAIGNEDLLSRAEELSDEANTTDLGFRLVDCSIAGIPIGEVTMERIALALDAEEDRGEPGQFTPGFVGWVYHRNTNIPSLPITSIMHIFSTVEENRSIYMESDYSFICREDENGAPCLDVIEARGQEHNPAVDMPFSIGNKITGFESLLRLDNGIYGSEDGAIQFDHFQPDGKDQFRITFLEYSDMNLTMEFDGDGLAWWAWRIFI